MERHLAAGALVSSGYDVLLTDATAVLLKPLLPYLRSQPRDVDLFFQRDDWPMDAVRRMGCAVNSGFVYMRAARGEQVAALIRDMVRTRASPHSFAFPARGASFPAQASLNYSPCPPTHMHTGRPPPATLHATDTPLPPFQR
jgi:hypothetical protein